MSTFKVPLTKIVEIKPHPNADRLQLAKVYECHVVVQKDRYKAGDEVVYIPIDSVLPNWLEEKLFSGSPIDRSKAKNRVKQIRIRSIPSEGIIVDLRMLEGVLGPIDLPEESDLSEIIGVTKWQPPQADYTPRGLIKRDKPKENPRFHKYNGLNHWKYFPNEFKEGEEVVIQEKLHGSNCRAGYLPTSANNLKRKILKFFGFLPKYEFCYGSNEVQLQQRPGNKGYYGVDVYGAVLKKVGAREKLQPGETIYGELIGPGIQKNYTYGHEGHHFVLFDVKVELEDGTKKWLNPAEVAEFGKVRGFDVVPVLYDGPFQKAVIEEHLSGPSVYCPAEPIREGIVIKAKNDYDRFGDKTALKVISPEYYDRDQTDFH